MKAADFFSERMIFGLLIIGGYLFCMGMLVSHEKLDPANLNLLSQGVGALGTAVGVIVAAIWKSDKMDRQVADTAAVLAAKAPDLSSSGTGSTPVTVVNTTTEPVPVKADSGPVMKPFMQTPIP